ncbi:MAG: hypothetical protein ACRERD_13375 [Candidatus Binatia bacterium]
MIWALFLVLATTAGALADATIPTADTAGSKDNPLLKHYWTLPINVTAHCAVKSYALEVNTSR